MKLTPDQKEHLKQSQRSNSELSQTWSLFGQFLAEGKPPAEALQKAREAMDVWMEYEDSAWIEPPDIEHPEFAEELGNQMQHIMRNMPKFAIPFPPNATPSEPAALPNVPDLPQADQPTKKENPL